MKSVDAPAKDPIVPQSLEAQVRELTDQLRELRQQVTENRHKTTQKYPLTEANDARLPKRPDATGPARSRMRRRT